MSKVADPVARAQKAGTKVQAARLYQELEAELALGDHGAEWDAGAEQALSHLESKSGEHEWGDLSEHEATVAYTHAGGGHRMAHTWAPTLSRSAGDNLDQGGAAAPRNLERGAHPAGHPEVGAGPSKRKHAARRRAGARIRARGGSRRAYGGLGPPPTAGARQMAGTALWGALGLVMLYLLLRDAENPRRGWPSAVQTAVRSITAFIDAIVRPVDPLNPRAKATKTPTSSTAAPGTTTLVGPPAPAPAPAGPAGPVGPAVSVGPPAPTPTPAGPAGPIGP